MYIEIYLCSLQMSQSKKEVYEKLLQAEVEIDNLISDKKAFQVMLLHLYNDIKDATQIVIDHIANLEETTVTEVHNRLQLYGWNKTLL